MRLAVLVLVITAAAAFLAVRESVHQGPALAGAAIQGDADCSGTIDPVDSLRILRHDSGAGVAPCADAADTNCDEAINPVDALRILRFDAGLSLALIQTCPSIGAPLEEEGGPTSEQLIDEALAAGEIDAETAILYKAWAAFADERLPDQYEGSGSPPEPPSEIWYRPDGLSQDLNAALDIYLLPPPAAGSWYNGGQAAQLAAPQGNPTSTPNPSVTPPPGDWRSVQPASGKAYVWWDAARPADEAKALATAADLDSIWGKFQTLLGIETLGDAGIAQGGPDAKYDVYLAPLEQTLLGYVSAYAAWPAGQPCGPRPSFMVLNNSLTGTRLRSTLAHESFHVFQNSFSYASSCLDVVWLKEATAAWSEDFAYPADNHERVHFLFPEYHNLPLNDKPGYAAYIFFLQLTRTGSPQLMATLFEELGGATVFEAIEAISDGGFNAQFRDLARNAWNRPPEDMLKQWDGIENLPQTRSLNSSIPRFAKPMELVIGQSEKKREYTAINTAVNQLGVAYYHFSTSAFGSGTIDPAHVRINNPYQNAPSYAGVQVGYKLVGKTAWSFRDISSEESTSFCLKLPSERVDELVVIVSNSSTTEQDLPEFSRPLAVTRDACGWTGSANVTRTDICSFDCDVTEDCSGCGQITITGQATDLVFEPVDNPTSGGTDQIFDLASGKLSFSVTGNIGTCNLSGGSTVDIPAGKGRLRVTPQEGGGIEYALYGFTDATFQYQDCNGTVSRQVGIWLCSGGAHMSTNDQAIQGSFHWQSPGTTPPACPVGGAAPAGASSNERDFSWNLSR